MANLDEPGPDPNRTRTTHAQDHSTHIGKPLSVCVLTQSYFQNINEYNQFIPKVRQIN